MANKNSFYHKHMAANLTGQLGYCTFRFDFVGNGEVCVCLCCEGREIL